VVSSGATAGCAGVSVTVGERRAAVDGTFPWRARIRARDGRIVGAGLLVDSHHVLTCAHVVTQATGEDPRAGVPRGEIVAEFPFWGSAVGAAGWQVAASVPSYGWAPLDAAGRGDVTLLRLREAAPAELAPAELDVTTNVDQRRVRVFGHPADLLDGVWAEVRLSGIAGPAAEWIQIDAASTVGRRVEQGFSGAGVIDPDTGRVLGVVVAEDPRVTDRVAWVIRTDVVVRYLPHLAGRLGAPRADAPDLAAAGGGRGTSTGSGVPQRPLSPQEQQSLFARFRDVPSMSSRSARDLYLDALEERLGAPLAVDRQPDDVLDMWAVLLALLARPGALRLLADLLTGMHAGHPAVARLVEFVDFAFPDLLLEHQERVELETRLRDVAWARVGAAYRFATGRFAVPPAVAPTSVAAVVRDLEARGRAHGEVPALMLMVEDVAHGVGGDLSLQLDRWVDRVAGRLGVAPADRDRICDDATHRHARPVPAHLVVMLAPDGVDLDRFLVSAVVMVGDQPERPVFRDDEARTLAEVEQVLDEQVLPLVPEAVGGEAEGLVVEFVLPDRVLDTPVERWQFDRAGFPRAIGIAYPVVVRSRERALDRSSLDAWQARTRRMQEQARRTGPEAVHVVHRDARTVQARDGEAAALWQHLVGAEETLTLAVPFPPQPPAGARGPDVFTAALKAGLPAIVWARRAVDPGGFERLVRGELLGEGVADLPRQVWRYRIRHLSALSLEPKADAFSDLGPGADADARPPLGLLMDDAARVPGQLREALRFRAPGPGRGPEHPPGSRPGHGPGGNR